MRASYAAPQPTTRVEILINLFPLVPGTVEFFGACTWKKYIDGGWDTQIVRVALIDPGKDGQLVADAAWISDNPHADCGVPEAVGLSASVDYATGTIQMESTTGYVTQNVSLYLAWTVGPFINDDTVTYHSKYSYGCFYQGFADNAPFEPSGQVTIGQELTPHVITAGTLTLYAGDTSDGPWTQIGSDNGSGVVTTDKGSGSLDYTTGLLSIAWNEAGYDKFWRATFTEERHIIDYATQFVAALDFGVTDLIPGGIAGSYQALGESWGFHDTPEGDLILVRDGLNWTKGGVTLDGTALGEANGFFFLWDEALYMSADGYGYQKRTLVSPMNAASYYPVHRVVFDGTHYFFLQYYNTYMYIYRLPEDMGSAEDVSQTLPSTLVDIAGVAGRLVAITSTKIYLSVDAGETWGVKATLTDLKRVYCFAGKVMLMTGTDCQWSTDLESWSPIVLPDSPKVVAYEEQSGTWLIGAGKNVYYSTDMMTWTPSSYDFHGCSVSQMAATNGRIMVSVNAGYQGPTYLVESLDGGVTWADVVDQLPELSSVSDYGKIMAGEGRWSLLMRFSNTGDLAAYGATDQVMSQDGTSITTIGRVSDYAAGIGQIFAGAVPTGVRGDILLTHAALTNFADFTRGGTPVTPGSYRLTATGLDGSELIAIGQDATLDLGGDATGVYDPALGFAVGTFAQPFDPSTLKRSFNYAASFKPTTQSVNTTSLPLNGMVPVVRNQDILVICDRQRYRLGAAIDGVVTSLALEDDRGWPPELPDPCTIEINAERLRVTGREGTTLTVERGADTTTAAPHEVGAVVTLITYNEEMAVAHTTTDTKLFTASNLSRAYSAGAEVLSALSHPASLRAAVTGYHTQASWDGATWQDETEYTGDPAAGTFDYVNSPIEVDNAGTLTDRWLAKVTGLSPLTLEIRGERHGVVVTSGDATIDISPANPRGGALFTLPSEIWGVGGHQIGEIYRFDTQGTETPYWSVRVINAQASDVTDDGCVHETRGDVVV